ncbi:hypothetical protein TNCV_2306431 [Trichonephila clavipes]|nr:hypothetical protein TNCV_2306431 [Trichonephila clavipes]
MNTGIEDRVGIHKSLKLNQNCLVEGNKRNFYYHEIVLKLLFKSTITCSLLAGVSPPDHFSTEATRQECYRTRAIKESEIRANAQQSKLILGDSDRRLPPLLPKLTRLAVLLRHLNPHCPASSITEKDIDAIRGLLVTDLVILNHGQVPRATPELATPSPNEHSTPTGGRLSSRQI